MTVASDSPGGERRRPRYGRWRAGTLIGVHVLAAAHIAHWRLSGRTLAPLELNEVAYTLEEGIVTAGFIFMGLAALSVLLFGRFFCSWGCHILALQDGCAWLLERFGLRLKPLRSRALLLVAPAVMALMFVWPQVARALAGEPVSTWHVMSPDDPWGSFVTDDFWRNLPGPWIAGMTFLICGGVIVVFLGTRSFCRYACPYGAIFGLLDRLSPGRIMVSGDCTDCGACTAVCQSHVRVHAELTVFGRVVDPACLKDLDCVVACPTGAVRFGWTKPSLFASWKRRAVRRPAPDYTLGEEVAAAAVVIATVLAFRGLYDAVPLLMSVGMGVVFAWAAVTTWRLLRQPDVRVVRMQLKRRGVLSRSGKWAMATSLLLAGLFIHSASIRVREVLGERAFSEGADLIQAGRHQPAGRRLASAFGHFTACERLGLVRSDLLLMRLASLHDWSNAPVGAEPYLRELIDRRPDEPEPRLRLAALLIRTHRIEEAKREVAALRSLPGLTESARTDIIRRIEEVESALGSTSPDRLSVRQP